MILSRFPISFTLNECLLCYAGTTPHGLECHCRGGDRHAASQRWDRVLEEKAPRRCSGGASLIELPSAVVTVMMVATARTNIQADAGASAIVAAMVVAIGAPVHLFGSRCDARAVETREA